MILDFCIQGTPEWRRTRAGVPTASNFNRIITSKGEPSKQRDAYLMELAAEAVAGPMDDSFDTYWMKRGRELEPEAIALYEFTTDNEVHSVGFVWRDEDKRVGCSPDNLAWRGDIMGGLEVKSPAPKTHVGYLLANKLPSDYFHQVQGCMWVSGAPWWDFMSYCPGMRPLIIHCTPDAAYHAALDRAMPTFLRDLDDMIENVRG